MTKQQKLLIAAIVGLGLLLAAFILLRGEHSADDGHDHAGSESTAPIEQHEEGEVELSAEQIRAAGISLTAAAPARLTQTLSLPGEIRLNEDRTAHVVSRVDGVVESVQADLGQPVKAGQLLAVIASPTASNLRAALATAQKRQQLAQASYQREKQLWEGKISAEQDFLSAQQALAEADIAVQNARANLAAQGVSAGQGSSNRFELRAPFAGTIVEKHLVLGEAVAAADQAFLLTDLSTVWATLTVPAAQLGAVRVGSPVHVKASAFASEAQGVVAYVGNLLGNDNRSAEARISLANPQGLWRPGLFVNVLTQTGEREAAITVPTAAIQTVEDRPTVFVRNAHGFIARAVSLGASDGVRTEILQGLNLGEQVAVDNSFVLKAELGKGEADHAH